MTECVVCGHRATTTEIRFGLIRWDDGTFSDGPRCVDRRACRDRLEARGERWPVRDAGEWVWR